MFKAHKSFHHPVAVANTDAPVTAETQSQSQCQYQYHFQFKSQSESLSRSQTLGDYDLSHFNQFKMFKTIQIGRNYECVAVFRLHSRPGPQPMTSILQHTSNSNSINNSNTTTILTMAKLFTHTDLYVCMR